MEATKCPRCTVKKSDREIIQGFGKERGNLLPILHALQDNSRYVAAEAMEEVADWLSIPVSEVYGTATFYSLFDMKKKGQFVIRLCDSPPCHIEGAEAVKRAIERKLGICEGETSKDLRFTFENVSCIGLCGVAPAMMINQDVYGNLTPDMIPGIIDKYCEEEL